MSTRPGRHFQKESSGRVNVFVQQMAISDDGKDLSHVVLTVEEVSSRGIQVEGFSKEGINIVKKMDPLL